MPPCLFFYTIIRKTGKVVTELVLWQATASTPYAPPSVRHRQHAPMLAQSPRLQVHTHCASRRVDTCEKRRACTFADKRRKV
jgi:hypothetical protein